MFGKILNPRRTCGNCPFNDGMCYMSNQPKYKCTFDNRFYDIDHPCHFELTPVIKGEWEQIQQWATKAKYKCSVCGREIMSAPNQVNLEKYPYCHCGAKMFVRGHRMNILPVDDYCDVEITEIKETLGIE